MRSFEKLVVVLNIRDGQLVDLEEFVFQARKFQIGLHTKMRVTQCSLICLSLLIAI